ncbi:MAG: dihydrolipoyl dehydrogenase [Bdellovibrionales bacterium]|nr:dihydrolipoyl dehydrogenase [Bdellovibrionales bacterium]
MRKVDVAIIGAGTSGLTARREVEKVTKNYVVIDPGPYGTTCARVGCMPSKVLIQVANDFHHRTKFAEQGILAAEQLRIDDRLVMRHVRKLRDRFVRSVLSGHEAWKSDHLVAKRAKFISKNQLQVGEETIEAQSIVIATGSRPIIPKTWEPFKSYLIDTDQFFELETLPKKIGIVGLGVIGIELGQALSRLGVDVTGLTIGKAIGGLSDPELQNYTFNQFSKEFPIYDTGADVVGERNGKLVVKSGDKEFEFDKVFLTMGRRPNVDEIGLEDIGIELDKKGIPVFDKGTFQIPNSRIFIAGDVNGERPLLHEAADEGRIVGFNSVRSESQCFQRREFLAITFADPNIAVVGKGFAQLKSENRDFVTGKVSFEGFGRAIIKLKEVGLMHVYGDKKSGKLLGAEIFGPDGEHLAHLLSWSMNLGLTAHDVLKLPFYHPVMEEALRTALRDLAEQVDKVAPQLEIVRCQDAPVR